MTDKNPKAVAKALETVARGGKPEQELFYDPATGALEVARRDEVVEDRDRVPATEMAREGFFR